ncbi:MAG: cysteine--tRNA ligase [Candidatus Diapherotrites archaeon]|uniref:Cysteine--tRNA ligase n=1 Tax=Candidatus Iainarchaeum sp. TaxID=3101447 RepID=A0A938YTY4_9ARCH|nr:cysteine--tRNA ligase [Candidatus Diapherotrites archaeon]
MLRLYNTLSRKKEAFKPLHGKKVGLYTCGPTVYNVIHIGNLKSFLAEDILKRYLLYKGFKVKHIRNITDVDDKTIRDSKAEGISLKEFTDRYTKAFFEDIEKARIMPADIYPTATQHIKEMVALVKKLLKKGIAYKAEDGSIYYSVSKFKGYGKLAHIDFKKLKAGARVKQDEYEKGEAQDFALWKAWSEEDGPVFWETELGKGRPGWHIECSAMSMKHLGESFDIHSGGVDLIFPHHENEIAQSEGATGKRLAKYWVHNAFLQVNGEKMSKSLGNFYTLRDLQDYNPIAVRYLMISGHYRQPLNFTFEGLRAAQSSIDRLNELVSKLQGAAGKDAGRVKKEIAKAQKKFESAMDDDLNTPLAFAALFEFARQCNSLLAKDEVGKGDAKLALQFLRKVDSVFALMDFKQSKEISKQDLALIKKREQMRREKKWAEADRIREELEKKGILLDDTASGTKWKLVK